MPGLGGSIIEVQSDRFYDKNSSDQRINGKKNKDNLDVNKCLVNIYFTDLHVNYHLGGETDNFDVLLKYKLSSVPLALMENIV